MRAHQLPHQSQADAGAFMRAGARGPRAMEALEHVRQILGPMPVPVSATVSTIIRSCCAAHANARPRT
jgi:hypothetical protein